MPPQSKIAMPHIIGLLKGLAVLAVGIVVVVFYVITGTPDEVYPADGRKVTREEIVATIQKRRQLLENFDETKLTGKEREERIRERNQIISILTRRPATSLAELDNFLKLRHKNSPIDVPDVIENVRKSYLD